LILAKHDAVQRGLVGEIISRFEQRGFKIVGLKLITPTEAHVGEHYADDVAWKKNVGEKAKSAMEERGETFPFKTTEEFGDRIRTFNMNALKGLPTVAIVFQGFHACEIGRKIVGGTDPLKAVPGTIRGDYAIDSNVLADKMGRTNRNLVHASGSSVEAEREIKIWFKPDELQDYNKKMWEFMHSFD
jgi:nucleoside-diphosphate kinase